MRGRRYGKCGVAVAFALGLLLAFACPLQFLVTVLAIAVILLAITCAR